MEWQLTDERKKQYGAFLKNAQDLEMTIGSTEFRVAKLIDMRKELDQVLRQWWEETLKELSLDEKKDYIITKEGAIQLVEQPSAASAAVPLNPVGTNAAELK